VSLAQQQRQRAQDVNLLVLLVGQPLPDNLAPAATLARTELSELPAGLPSDLLAVRPDIRAAEQQLVGANANIGAARANFFPRISLTGSAGSGSTELSGLFKGGSFGWSFAPSVVLPIFDYGRNSANLGAAKAGRDIAVAQYEKSIQAAFREVSDALAGQATLAEQLRAQRAVAAAEAERFTLSDLRYRSGASSYLDRLDAQRSLFSAQQAAGEPAAPAEPGHPVPRAGRRLEQRGPLTPASSCWPRAKRWCCGLTPVVHRLFSRPGTSAADRSGSAGPTPSAG
jgi:NodT family efflux transporter outer membrane factor (OMF) lipoprotein